MPRRDAAGWEYWYIHINNDTPGTDDGLNPLDHAFAPGIVVGGKVSAGQVVAYAGDSGNAESTGAHLHFERRHSNNCAISPEAVPATWPSGSMASALKFEPIQLNWNIAIA